MINKPKKIKRKELAEKFEKLRASILEEELEKKSLIEEIYNVLIERKERKLLRKKKRKKHK